MPNYNATENEFLTHITKIVEENISIEQFGVSELADKVSMSRSNLLRKVKKLTDLSVSQFIRNIRLKHAKEILAESSLSVSEVSYKVGFGSPSYFIKCFREFYGYPPGEEGSQMADNGTTEKDSAKKKIQIILVSIAVVLVVATLIFVFLNRKNISQDKAPKSIAVLPFINDSSDSSNVYIINGLMESTLNKLQKIEGLRVISRTSVEKYRNNPKPTPEIANELNATYLIEGSGQKIGDQIQLNIQLIEAASDKHLWNKQYQRKAQDIFTLQAEVAKNIAKEIEIIITPEEAERIEKVPTENLEAYDTFLKGLNLLNQPVTENLEESIHYFKKAIKLDNKFARSYAALAITYYLLDEGRTEKQYSDSINYYADQALFFDSKLPQSLIAKALFYMAHKQFELAEPYFEKALEISPNNDVVLIFLVDLYVHHLPNTAKYLEYALKGLEIDLVAAYDSTTASYSYLHISNAFIQSGFVEEAEKYINKSLDYFPGNLYSQYVKAYILFAKNQDLELLKNRLHATYEQDSSRLDIMQELGKVYYYLGDYSTSYKYYKKFIEIKELYKLDMYNSENGKIGYVFNEVGEKEKARELFEKFKMDGENTQSVYKHYNLSLYYSYIGETEKAIEHLELFTMEQNFHYWLVIFTPLEPLAANMQKHPRFEELFQKIEKKFSDYNSNLEQSLKEKGLI